ncbi:MAG: NAD(P)/FAD-dependent oxidoreductase [Phycisphaerae bacterium]|nr:NAD(P)/FAD-dependent oxidoreductase [Phycisphaerae bacterium]
MKCDVCIIGGGAAGLMASVFAARSGATVAVIERNTSVGRKLLVTGRGRCNLTHDGSINQFVQAYDFCGRFLKHSLYEFSPADTIEFFAKLGVKSKTEDDGSIFPATDKAATVKNALLEEAQRLGVKIIYGRRVERILKDESGFTITAGTDTIKSKSVIIATGGKSYPDLGSTGDGYSLAEHLGHNIIKPVPALASLVTEEKWLTKLQGVALGNVKVSTKINGKKISSAGPMMFTGKGIGGPAIFEFSRFIAEDISNITDPLDIQIDLLAAESEEDFRYDLSEYSNANPKKKVLSFLSNILPARLAAEIIAQADISEKTTFAQLTKRNRGKIIQLIKRLSTPIKGTSGFAQATITRGGVDTKQIDPKTMQSKIAPGLYFAGEVINADGPCGGYNLQIAWSTAVLAAKNVTDILKA